MVQHHVEILTGKPLLCPLGDAPATPEQKAKARANQNAPSTRRRVGLWTYTRSFGPCGRGAPFFVLALEVAVLWLGAAGCASPRKEPDLRLMTQAWNIIQRHYVSPEAVQPKELTYGALSGMVEALGDSGHSMFLTPDMVKELKKTERGELKGVGLELQVRNGQVVVVTPIDGSPAQRAGVQAGDIILKIAGQDISDWPLTRIVQRISGRVGSRIALTLQDPHSGQSREVALVRATIQLHAVTWQRLPGTTFAHVRVASFDKGATRDLRQALEDIQREGLAGLVLDLRNNPGGLLEEAIGVASQFLVTGNVLLAKNTQGEVQPVPVLEGGLAADLPLVVLVNEGSASAAEIVAGALRDARRAELVGETTFGTGTVLEQFQLADGSALLLAVEEWLTPNGDSIWHEGIKPQVEVALAPGATPILPAAEKEMSAEQLQACEDRQLVTALQSLGSAEERRPARRLLSTFHSEEHPGIRR